MASAATTPTRRRLIACCDGTWNRPDRTRGSATNVIRLVRAIRPCTDDGISQIVHYHPGVGTGNLVDRLAGGSTGIGLSENVRSTYGFFVDNYRDGDEIFLFGFSRGAYTVRSVAGMMGHVGILRKRHMHNFDQVWDYYRLPEEQRNHEEKTFFSHFPGRVPADQVEIRCIGVWDTVGSLGIPDSHFCKDAYEFHDTNLGPGVHFAFHALALDEQRKPFKPAIWKPCPTPRVTQTLQQVWFPGVHSNIGGGYPEHVLSDAPLFWMAAKVAPLLDLDRDYLCMQAHADREGKPRYATGELVDSRTGSWKLFPRSPRKPLATDPSERIHESAVLRANNVNGPCVPSPYRDAAFRALLQQNAARIEPLSDYEKSILAAIPNVEPEVVLEREPRMRSVCDRLVTFFGGSA